MTDEILVAVLLNQVALILAAIERASDQRIRDQLHAALAHTEKVVNAIAAANPTSTSG